MKHCEGCDLTEVPWSDDEVASLNAYQECGYMHPFTASDGETLFATPDGWVHPISGVIRQTWAHRFMTDWSWKGHVMSMQRDGKAGSDE